MIGSSGRRGRVILLTGASSSGKSSAAAALLGLLPGPWYLMAIDDFGAMRSDADLPTEDAEIQRMLARTRMGFHRAVAGFASAGNDVVMDYPLTEQWRIDDLAEVLRGFDVLVVEVTCSLEELTRRELARGNRPLGLAASQRFVHEHGLRDVLVDTTDAHPLEVARQIVTAMTEVGTRRALARHPGHGETNRPRIQ